MHEAPFLPEMERNNYHIRQNFQGGKVLRSQDKTPFPGKLSWSRYRAIQFDTYVYTVYIV